MRMFSLSRCAFGLCLIIATAVSGCGSRQLAASGAPAIGAGDVKAHGNLAQLRSWKKPNAPGRDLLYITGDNGASGVGYIYTYPQGKRVGTLTGLVSPLGECTDSAGDVFIVAYANSSFNSSTIYEYAHGDTSPIAALNDPGVGWGCAIDPTTGNLAVGNGGDESNPYYHGYGDVAVYTAAQGSPTMYYSSFYDSFALCGYDNKGNLYLAAWTAASQRLGLARLTRGSTAIDSIDLNTSIYESGGIRPSVQWDGKHMTVSSARGPHATGRVGLVYRLKISGTTAVVIGTTELRNPRNNALMGQSWIFGNAIVANEVSPGYGEVAFWPYPQGGKPTHIIRRVMDLRKDTPFGITLSPAVSR